MTIPSQQRIRFGVFEVDVRSGELRQRGSRVDLQDQPFQALVLLLERPGEVVTRDELSRRLWPENTFVDFDRGLNKAINKLRVALRDDAENPRYIETLPQRGYRFMAPVEALETGEAQTQLSAPQLAERMVSTTTPSSLRLLPWAVASAFALLAVIGFANRSRTLPGVDTRPFLHFDLDVAPDEFSQPTISPDGLRIVFVTKDGLALRGLEGTQTVHLAGTEGGFFPFFSPDSRQIAYFAKGKLQRVAIAGGTPVVLCASENPGGGSWADDGTIIASLNTNKDGLSRIPAVGGTPQPLTSSILEVAGASTQLWPQVLAGGKAVLFAAVNGSKYGSLRILNLSDGRVTTVVENATRGRLLPNGYLVYYRQSRLFAVPIDERRWVTTGTPVNLIAGISNEGGAGRGEFDVSDSGTMVYRTGMAGNSFVVSWLYPSGKTEPVLAKPDGFITPRLSPDGDLLAVAIAEDEKQRIWIYDLKRESWARLTTENYAELLPTWTPDGKFIAFRSGDSLAWARSDGSGPVSRLNGASTKVAPWSFSGDGRWLGFWPLQPESDLWTAPVERAPGTMKVLKPQHLLQHGGSKGAPAISPDGRWVAYASNESGLFETYVTPFSPQATVVSGKWLVSSGGGFAPIWSHNGRKLFYQGLDRRVRVADYEVTGEVFRAAKPRVWSETQLGETGIFNAFDVAPDGSRVIALLGADEPKANMLIRVALNLDSELRRIAPARSDLAHGN